MEFYESPYFIILVPSLVITLIFLFFWLFMKETSYDEVLAKQKKDQKLPPAKVDKKKTERRKNKKKDAQNGTLHESDSESAGRDFELMDALATDEERIVPVSLSTPEAPSNLRDRKKKEKKQSKPAPEEQLAKETGGAKFTGKKVEPVPITKQPTPPSDTAVSKKKQGPKKLKNGREDSPVSSDTKAESFVSPTKKHESINLFEVKQESGAGKRKGAIKKQKVENVPGLVDEPLIEATTYIPLMDNTNANPMVEKDLNNTIKNEHADVFQKSNVKKLKNETDKENADVRVKDFLVAMKNMIFTEEEALRIVELLKEKSNAVQDAIQKANKGDSVAALRQLQEKDKMLLAVKEEAALTKEQFKQLTQELLTEKQKGSLMEAKVRERISTLEKENAALQNKMHTNYQDTQQMQLKFKQVREQMENQITHLKQENGILRDAVSSATNQMESKQTSELNKLRQDCARLMNELAEKNSKVAQEELQKKSTEQAVAQLTAQHQEAERRREEIETYLRKMTAQYEDIQAKSLAKENEIKSLHSKLTDTVVSKQQLEQRIIQLMEEQQTRVTEDSLKIQMQELVEQNELMKVQIQNCHTQLAAQASTSVLVEELQKAIAEKGKQIKQTEDSLAKEHAHLTSNEEELKASQRENLSLKAELQKLQAVKSEQVSAAHLLEQMQRSVGEKEDKIRTLEDQLQNEHLRLSSRVKDYKALQNQNTALQAEIQKLQAQLFEQANKDLMEQMQRSVEERDEKIKTVEELLETGLIEVANKEEELKFFRKENSSLKKEVQNLLSQQSNEVSLNSMVEELQRVIHEKDGKIKSVEELLQGEYLKTANKEQTVQALLQEIESLKEEERTSQREKTEQVSNASLVQELQNQLKGQGEQVKVIEVKLEEREKDNAHKDKELQVLRKENEILKDAIEVAERQHLQQVSQELQNFAKKQGEELKAMAAKLEEREHNIAYRDSCIKDLERENEILKINVQELQQQNHQQIQQVSSAVQNEELLKVVAEKEMQITTLQNELESSRTAVEQQRNKNNDLRAKNWKAMEALASTEKMLQEKMNKTTKEREQYLQAFETDERKRLQKLFPQLSVSSSLKHGEWIQEFEKLAQAKLNESAGSAEVKLIEQRLKEAEEVHTVLQQECEKYKSVLAETEGILQRLQRSVEEEESRWRLKIEESQKELQEMQSSVHSLEQENEKLRQASKEAENFKREREHLETELEKAELERATYVSEVRELKELLTELQKKLDDSYSEAVRQNEELNLLKIQLNETLMKLEGEQNERQKVAGDLYQAQQSLDLIQSEIVQAAGDSSVIENSSVSSEMESERKEKGSANLNQTVTQLQQLLQAVNQQLTKGHEHYQIVG
ncbi:kinectin isoform X2 [Microcaecilia unicolor]|uniref:Kinectin isoform X2 n=1 Tax=Microcaecilia unicolor TaxID=1415580 RepID=A0A6P7Z2N3_9AMPH|nr:kinectin isoform X2 [Microcaecilia unicolor]